MKNEYILKKFNSGMHYIILEEKIVKKLIKEGNKRIICNLNNEIEFHSAIMTKKEGGYFINIGSTHCKKLKIKEGSKVFATFSVDSSYYQFEMPEELKEALKKDKEANKIFHSLTKGNQRGLMYLVNAVKSKEKRIQRTIKILDGIKTGVTSPKKILLT